MKRPFQEGFDITKLVGAAILVLAATTTFAAKPIEEPLYTDERAGVDAFNADPMSADGCAQADCDSGCAFLIHDYPMCYITSAACMTDIHGNPTCSCAWKCRPVGGKIHTPYTSCAVIVDSTDGQ